MLRWFSFVGRQYCDLISICRLCLPNLYTALVRHVPYWNWIFELKGFCGGWPSCVALFSQQAAPCLEFCSPYVLLGLLFWSPLPVWLWLEEMMLLAACITVLDCVVLRFAAVDVLLLTSVAEATATGCKNALRSLICGLLYVLWLSFLHTELCSRKVIEVVLSL